MKTEKSQRSNISNWDGGILTTACYMVMRENFDLIVTVSTAIVSTFESFITLFAKLG